MINKIGTRRKVFKDVWLRLMILQSFILLGVVHERKKTMEILMPDLPEYTEIQEFFVRELGLVGKKIDHRKERPLPENSLIYCHDISHWQKRLELSDKFSVSVILVGNENYDVNKWEPINEYESIKCAFLQYFPKTQSSHFRPILEFIANSINVVFQKSFWAVTLNGYLKHRAVKRLKFRFPVHPFPLGYTDRFVLELQKLGLCNANSKSLFGALIAPLPSEAGGISFFGQKGSWYRRHMVEQFERSARASVQRYDSFGGDTQPVTSTQYVNSILNSRFVLCPPGNVSSQSFRYYEAIALGAIPIITEISVQDWNSQDYWPQKVRWKHSNYKEVWKGLKSLSNSELDNLSLELRDFVQREFAHLRGLLEECTGRDNVIDRG